MGDFYRSIADFVFQMQKFINAKTIVCDKAFSSCRFLRKAVVLNWGSAISYTNAMSDSNF